MTDPIDDLATLRAALAAANDLAYVWDLETDAIHWLGNVDVVLGCRPNTRPMTGEALKGRINPQDLPNRLLAMSEHFAEPAGGAHSGFDAEYRVRTADGGFVWVHDRGQAKRDPETGSATRFIGVLRLIEQRKQHEAKLEYLANYDELTGFYNRKRLRESLTEHLNHAQRYEVPGCYLVLGIDKLPIISEGYGHAAVDAALIAAAQRLESCLRSSDIVGRIGNDLFGVILTRCPAEDVAKVQSKLLSTFREYPLATPFGSFPVTASVGAISFPAPVSNSADMMNKAELALQQARLRGADKAVDYAWSEDKQASHRQNVIIGEQVLHALRDQRLVFAYQPVVDAASGRVAFHEALMRLRTPSGDYLPAGQFMEAVEELGLHRVIDQHGLDLAVRALRESPDLVLALNISSLTLGDSAWLRRLSGQFRHRHDMAHRLIVEITETAAMQDLEESVRFVQAVRALGCRVAIDDFGSGYTSFRQLRALTVDLLKIDGSFIRNVRNNESNRLFVRTLLDLARGFGLDTVAEFIECEEDARFLEREGVTFLQGYHYGRPSLNPPWADGTSAESTSFLFGRLSIPRAKPAPVGDAA